MKKIVTYILPFFIANLFAQSPQAFNYQGAARDGDGLELKNQTISLRMSILDGSITGPSVYSESHTVTTTELGLFALAIGTGTIETGTFSTIDWGAGSKFLKVEMDIEGGSNYIEMGTNQLLSTPYALYAESSGGSSLWNQNGNDISYTNGNVSIGTTQSKHPLKIEVTSLGPDDNRSAICLKNNTSDSYSTVGLLLEGSNANSGIATLHLINDSYAFNNNAGKLMLSSNAPNGITIRSSLEAIAFEVGVDIDTNKEKMTIQPNGNVGIGTSDPKAKLEVAEGDIFISNISSGVIMKSPNGSCFRMTVSDTGAPVFSTITCP